MADAQDILDRLARGELDINAVLEHFEDAPRAAVGPQRTATGKLVLGDVQELGRATPRAPARGRLQLAPIAKTVEGEDDKTTLTMLEGGVALVRMRDDSSANMFTPKLLAELRGVFAEIERRVDAKVVVVTGTETWFCCGGTPEDLTRMRDGRASFFDIDGFRILLDCSQPTIAAMHGHALGGGLTFGLYADVTLLAEHAYYSANFMEHGLTPGVGTTYILPKKLGATLGAEMMLTANRYQGRDLKARGAPLEVLDKGAVLPRALSIAREMAKHPVPQLKLLKRRGVEETRRELPRVLHEEDRMHAQCYPRAFSFARAETAESLGDSLPRPPRAFAREETSSFVRARVIVERRGGMWSVALNRPEARNSIDVQLLEALHGVLDEVDEDASAKVLVLCGLPSGGVFCTGLDLRASADASARTAITSRFMALMKRLSSMPKIVVALVDGEVIAGGIGLVAASDFVFATPRSTFALTEALWGLLPATVLPFLIRRTGFGGAYAMTMSADTINADAARAMRLVDDVITEGDLIGAVERKARRFARLETSTIGAMKAYFRELWIVDEGTEERAVSEIQRLLADPIAQRKMKDYAERGTLPWEDE